jgi:hypothetical protein
MAHLPRFWISHLRTASGVTRAIPAFLALWILPPTPEVRAVVPTSTWINPAGGSWADPANWDSGEVPGEIPEVGGHVRLPNLGGPYTIDANTSPHVHTLVIEPGVTLVCPGTLNVYELLTNGGTIHKTGQLYGDIWNQTTGTITVSPGTSIHMRSASVVNDGVITVGPTLHSSIYFEIDATFTGAGELVITGGTFDGGSLRRSPVGTANLVNGAGHTIRTQGAGAIVVPLTNHGILHASAGPMSLPPGSSDGVLRVSDGGALSLSQLVHHGEIVAGNGTISGVVDLQGSTAQVDGNLTMIGGLVNGTLTGTGSVSVTGSNSTLSNLAISGVSVVSATRGTISNLQIAPESELLLTGTPSVSGVLLNHGLIRVGSGTITGVGATLDGTGTSLLAGGALAGSWTLESSQTLRGSGSAMGDLVNRGLVEAGAPGHVLNLRGGANHGVMRATNGGSLNLSDATLTNPGRIEASGGVVRLDGMVIENTDGEIVAVGSDVWLSRILGSQVRGGTIGASGGGRFTNGKQSTLENLTVPAGTEVLTSAQGTTTLSGIVNEGTLRVLGTLEIAGDRMLKGSGRCVLEGGTLRTPDGDLVHVAGHVIQGDGRIAATLVNGGTVQPGASPGTLALDGLEQLASGRIEIELAGTGAGEFDRLEVAGQATLGGTLAVAIAGGYAPAEGDAFQVMTFGSRSGDFTTYEGLALGGGGSVVPFFSSSGDALYLRVHEGTTGVPGGNLPAAIRLHAPSNGRGDLMLELPRPADASIGVFDAAGRQVWEASMTLAAGVHRIPAREAGLAAGMYFARASIRSADGVTRHRARMAILR